MIEPILHIQAGSDLQTLLLSAEQEISRFSLEVIRDRGPSTTCRVALMFAALISAPPSADCWFPSFDPLAGTAHRPFLRPVHLRNTLKVAENPESSRCRNVAVRCPLWPKWPQFRNQRAVGGQCFAPGISNGSPAAEALCRTHRYLHQQGEIAGPCLPVAHPLYCRGARSA